MKVKELIKELQSLDPEMEVLKARPGIAWRSFVPIRILIRKYLHALNNVYEETPLDDEQTNKKEFLVIE